MRTLASLALVFLLGTSLVHAQGMMRFYRMAYGISGFYSTGGTNLDISQVSGTGVLSDLDRETVRLSTRDGYFLTRNLLVGLELGWSQTKLTGRPDPNPTSYRSEHFERRFFLGPLVRWYQPVTMRWFLYPEIAVGYSHYLQDIEESDIITVTLPSTVRAHGIAVQGGAGLGYFVTRNLVFDASLRYRYAWHDGEFERPGLPNRDVDMTEWDVELLVGFQLLL